MTSRRLRFLSAFLLSLPSGLVARPQTPRSLSAATPPTVSEMPHLAQQGGVTQLVVDGKPMLILGGEVHNSSSSSVAYMEAVWPRLTALHVNTVLVPEAWETIEPQEGQFDFSNLDGLLRGARANHQKLVLLWFGAWKNTFSSYVPGWVKRNTERFPRVETSSGRLTERLSPFSKTVDEADARAFRALMHHVKGVDSQDHTVLMIQVENEVGVLPESRDHSKVAEAAFHGPVPPALLKYMEAHRTTLNPAFRTAWEQAGARTSGTWQEVFGSDPLTDDLFMAWHYATYTERVAAAGKAEYALPMYANAALIRPNYQPGQYNSGGPLPHSLDIWHAGAPALDFFSPDIYFNEFALWAGEYTRPGNPLFIPEAQGGTNGPANALYAFGHLNAVGFSVFGIDDLGNAPLDLVGITNPGERPDQEAIGHEYNVLNGLVPLLLQGQSEGKVTAALMEGEAQRAARLALGQYTANISRTGGGGSRVGVLALQNGPDEFLITGSGDAQISFSADTPGSPYIGISSVDEMFLRDGTLTLGRRLNGDETGQGQSLRLFSDDAKRDRLYRVRLYRYR